MCGVFGVFDSKSIDRDRSFAALNTLQHRGPDQWGEWHAAGAFIGHRRLSIIDLSEQGRQPMVSADTVIAVNGEIYNFKELRTELEPHFQFHSDSDSEVVLHGYRAWGIDQLLERLDGMYVLAIYDRSEKALYLARDRFGKKPLFYTHNGDRLVFGSEVKALFAYDESLRVFSYDGIKNWVYYRGSNLPSTIYHNINRLPPGSFLKWQYSQAEIIHYYDLVDYSTDGSASSPHIEADIDDLLNAAVQKRLMADVPLGLQLSGGVDSSLIAYYLKRNQVGRLHSFSVGFSDLEDAKYSEEEHARHVADAMGLEHHQVNLVKQDVVAAFEQVLWLFDGMLDYPNAIAAYLLNHYAKQYVTVLLTGEGADELFCGYRKYSQVERLVHQSSFLRTMVPGGTVELAARLGRIGAARKLYLARRYGGRRGELLNDLNSYINRESFEHLFGRIETTVLDNMCDGLIQSLPFYRQLQVVDHKTYLYSLLDRQDRTSMGASIEARGPFLDRKLVEYAVSLPQQVLYDDRETKVVLKEICSNIFGEQFTYRRKQGFPLPLASWLTHEQGFRPYVERVFDDDNLLRERLDLDAVKDYLGSSVFSNRLLNYGDSDHVWVTWFLMVLRATQDVFHIKAIR